MRSLFAQPLLHPRQQQAQRQQQAHRQQQAQRQQQVQRQQAQRHQRQPAQPQQRHQRAQLQQHQYHSVHANVVVLITTVEERSAAGPAEQDLELTVIVVEI